jgi:hypothetical protein
MADFKIKYGTPADLTITLASLASSTTRLAGRESTAIDNSSNLYVDALVSGKITTAGTLTANRRIEIWVYAQHDDTPTYMDVLDGTDSDETFAVEAQRNSAMRLAAMILLPDTTARTYWFAPFSVAALFGGVMPKRWGIWVTQDSGAALSATGSDHDISYIGIHGQSV